MLILGVVIGLFVLALVGYALRAFVAIADSCGAVEERC